MKIHEEYYTVQIWENDAWQDETERIYDLSVCEDVFNDYVKERPQRKFRIVQYVTYLRSIKERL